MYGNQINAAQVTACFALCYECDARLGTKIFRLPVHIHNFNKLYKSDNGYAGAISKGRNFLDQRKKPNKKGYFFEAGIKLDYPMPVFHFLSKFTIQFLNFRIAK